MSADGKISPGVSNELDVDKAFPKIADVREGLHQYYGIAQTTDLWSLNSGRVQAKVGVNEMPQPGKTPVSFAVIDNHHLTAQGVRYFCTLSNQFVLITSNASHPAFALETDNLYILYQSSSCLKSALETLKSDYCCKKITLQTGGTLNGPLLREKLIDHVDLVVPPVLIDGRDTTALIDGQSLLSEGEPSQLGVLPLQDCAVLENSYLRLRYKVIS